MKQSFKIKRDVFIICLIAISIAAYFIYLKHSSSKIPVILMLIFATVFFISLLSTAFATAFLSIWTKFGELLGKYNAILILTLVYGLLLLPLSFLKKLFSNANNLQKQSSWYNRNHSYAPTDFEKLW